MVTLKEILKPLSLGVIKTRLFMKSSAKKGQTHHSSQKSHSVGATTQSSANPNPSKRDSGCRGGYDQGGKSAERRRVTLTSLISVRDNVNLAIITNLVSINNFVLTAHCLLDSTNEQVDYASLAIAYWLREHSAKKKKENF